MRKDLFKELGMTADRVILSEKDLFSIKGGVVDIPIDVDNGAECLFGHLNLIKCSANKCDANYCGNPCDVANLGACPGNTISGGPRTCPLSA